MLGLGFGLPGAYGAWYHARHSELWTYLGFPTYGGFALPFGPLLGLARTALVVAVLVSGD